LVDVRTLPRSARHPHFNRGALSQSLESAGIAYRHMPGLGGLRRPLEDSINHAWRNSSFRGYADYMQTPAFQEHRAALLAIAAHRRTAIMCAEAVPWRCHRSLVADALVANGATVEHILSATRCEPHRLSRHARVSGTVVSYPAAGVLWDPPGNGD